MKSKNSIEDDLNATRVRLYEETKGMTPSERVAYLKALAAPVREKHGILTLNEIREKESTKAAP
jgi:hypothetical protein